jgi:cell division protease FtsH
MAPPPQGPNRPQPLPLSPWALVVVYALGGLALLWFWQHASGELEYRSIPYSQFKSHLAAGEVRSCEVRADEIRGRIERDPAEGEKTFLFRAARLEDPDLVSELEAADVEYTGVRILTWLLPVGLFVLLWILLSRRIGAGAGQAAMTFGRARARLVADKDVDVDFDDVAGCEEAKTELREIVEFLRNPARFTALGAEIPRGVLLVGPPGTGKTLLARAVAGEAGVPFFSLSGSEFVEMFVGVGAARVRDLFEQAKRHAPCIVFIDELDAVGRARGVRLSQMNDERENTLNQLLVEMDGFEPNAGVVLLSATNRPDVLDPALLRPGRFDRQVVLDAPDVAGREAILRVHARTKTLGSDVDLAAVAQATPGFCGADLANAMNEAALLAARRGGKQITQADLEEAVEKVVAGPERRSRRLGLEEKRRVAYHEVGHAIVSVHCKHADPVRKISIVPRGKAALGYTIQLPTGDRHLLIRSALMDRIKGLLGGRASEELIFGEVSSGAENDLEQATALARALVARLGMGKAVGLMHCVRQPGPLLAADLEGALPRDCSEETARLIDEEVKGILDEAYAEAKRILQAHRDQLERVAETLLARETLDEASFRALLSG